MLLEGTQWYVPAYSISYELRRHIKKQGRDVSGVKTLNLYPTLSDGDFWHQEGGLH